VSQKQKKIDMDIPKLGTFVHKCYIAYARKMYSNVYLFEKDILPLNYQKNMREAELMCQEAILHVIRENMPVEKILRAYIDETVDEEIIEETIEKQVTELERKNLEADEKTDENTGVKTDGKISKTEDTVTLEKPNLEKAKVIAEALKEYPKSVESMESTNESTKESTNESTEKPNREQIRELTVETPVEGKKEVVSHLKFNDIDSVVKYDIKASPVNNPKPEEIKAPKTLERLEKISYEANEKRKAEEAEDEEDEEDDKIKIFDNVNLELDKMDIHSLDKTLKLEPDPILTDIEILG